MANRKLDKKYHKEFYAINYINMVENLKQKTLDFKSKKFNEVCYG